MNKLEYFLLVFLSRHLLKHLRDDNPVIIDLSFFIDIPEIIKGDFIISRQEEFVLFRVNSHINISQSTIKMHKNDIVVENEGIHDDEGEINEQSEEIANET